MVGFARLVTDTVTFAYLTDVYVLKEHQGRGLGKWLMRCLDEAISEWPELRRCVLFTGDRHGAKLYAETLGMRDISLNEPNGLIIMERVGKAGVKGKPRAE